MFLTYVYDVPLSLEPLTGLRAASAMVVDIGAGSVTATMVNTQRDKNVDSMSALELVVPLTLDDLKVIATVVFARAELLGLLPARGGPVVG